MREDGLDGLPLQLPKSLLETTVNNSPIFLSLRDIESVIASPFVT